MSADNLEILMRHELKREEVDKESETPMLQFLFGAELCCRNIFLVNHVIFQSDRKHPLSKLHRLISERAGLQLWILGVTLRTKTITTIPRVQILNPFTFMINFAAYLMLVEFFNSRVTVSFYIFIHY